MIKKKHLFAISLFLIAGVVISCNKDSNNLPEAVGIIMGENQNTCPISIVTLTIEPVDNAISYQWYKDNTLIPDATKSYYTVTESGIYTVAGVNENGPGKPSPAKEVNIIHCPIMDRLIGEWDVIESIYQNTEEGWQGPVPNTHIITISKIDETSIKITGLYITGEDEIIATVNTQTIGSETISIATQEIIPSRYEDARTFVSPVISATFSAGYGQSFNLPIKDVSGRLLIELKGGYTLGNNYYSYTLGSVDTNGTYTGASAYAINTRWVKK